MITVPKNMVDAFYTEGMKVLENNEAKLLVATTEARAQKNGTSISTIMYVDQQEKNTLHQLVLNCIVAKMTGAELKVERYPTN